MNVHFIWQNYSCTLVNKEWKYVYSSYPSHPRHNMDVGGQPHGPAALALEKELAVSLE